MPAFYSPEPGVLILEDLGGRMLADIGASGPQLRMLGKMLKQMGAVSGEGCMPLTDYLEELQTELSQDARLTPAEQSLAKKYALKLQSATPENYLLHGDFHGRNVLGLTDGSLAIIDPYSLCGDRAFDLAHFAVCWNRGQEQCLKLLLEGYGEMPPRLDHWFRWLSIARYFIALKLVPAEIKIRRDLVARLTS